jgi:hypothetical protein
VTTGQWDENARRRRYDELLQQIGASLIGAAPQGWRRIDVVARLAEGVQDYGLTVIMPDMSTPEMELPAVAAQAFPELRTVTYQPARGAWLSARYVINPPGEFRIFYNTDHDPLWSPPLPPAVLARDLATFPRPAEQVPGWLRCAIEQTPVAPEPPVDRSTALGVEEQRDLQRAITDLLVLRAPADRDQIRVVYRAAGGHTEIVGHVLGIDGRLREWEPPPELPPLYRRLRAGTYRSGVGTWSAASTVVEYPIRSSTRYLSEEDPHWVQPPPRYAVLDELEMFPRAPEHVPAWMTTVLPNAERVAEVAGRFRHARIFDHRDADGRPVVDRPPVPGAEVEGVLHYLDSAHVVMGGRGFDPDVFAPGATPDVPAGFHTDGTWIWPASLPHYLGKYGVPPEPDLVAHLRAKGHAPPELDRETKDAAYTALTGELPAPPPAPRHELSDRDRRVLAIIEQRVSEAGAIPEAYRILGSREGAYCLERVGDEWQVAQYERGAPRDAQRFTQLWNAGAYLLGSLTILPGALRAGGGDRNTARAVNDWPVQPLPGEPPLTLLEGKHVAVLMPGRELVRYGGPAGNLTFAAHTAFGAMSLRSEREQQGPCRYRVARELRTVSGTTVPWHGGTGGGTAYLLPRSVDEHLADGSLTAEPA